MNVFQMIPIDVLGIIFFSVFLLRFLFLRPEDSEVQEGGVEMEFLT